VREDARIHRVPKARGYFAPFAEEMALASEQPQPGCPVSLTPGPLIEQGVVARILNRNPQVPNLHGSSRGHSLQCECTFLGARHLADIFISYATPDRARIEPLAKALATQGWTVWWDRNVLGGQKWKDVIWTELNAARCVIVGWSKVSESSNWVLEEARVADKANKLVPIFLEQMEAPFGFGGIQTLNLSAWHGQTDDPVFQELCSAIRGKLTATPAPPAPPPAPAPAPPPAPKSRPRSPLLAGAAGLVIIALFASGVWWWTSDAVRKSDYQVLVQILA
jgi:hypothetical protein